MNIPPSHTDIGFLGLGRMGSAIAERLLGQSYRLHVYDPVDSAMAPFVQGGATAHASPRSVADVASVVWACLPSQAVSMEVALGESGVVHGQAIRVYGEMSTVGGEAITQIAQGLQARGITTLDSPVTGGPPVARAGQLTLLVAGPTQALVSVRSFLDRMGGHVFVLGDTPGQGQTMKVVNNLIMAANMVVASEGLAMGAKAGLDAGVMLEVLAKGSGQSFAVNQILLRGVLGAFDFGAALSILEKDTTLGLKEAASLGVAMPTIDSARSQWHAAYEAGFGDRDFTSVMAFIEEANGTLIRDTRKA